jgi:hypothetical protein
VADAHCEIPGGAAPEGRVTFHAGWTDQRPNRTAQTELENFLELIERGGLSSEVRYDVRIG